MISILYAFLLVWCFLWLVSFAVLGAAAVAWLWLYLDDKWGEYLEWRFKRLKRRAVG